MTNQQQMPSIAILSGAEISDDHTYRYRLWRKWDDTKPTCLFVMLNPSTADAQQDDPTIRRCIDYAARWGYGQLLVGNLFALRSTHPGLLYQHTEPTGYGNDAALSAMHSDSDLTVAAWGTHGGLIGRGEHVKSLLNRAGLPLVHHLGLTKGGFPKHPLYLRKDLEPVVWQ